MIYIIVSILLFISMLLYFRIAKQYNIIDRPNERSSHTEITIRGGGIIYLIAALLGVVMHPDYWLPVSAMFIIGIISFMDDRITLSSRVRLLFHLTAVSIIFYYFHLFTEYAIWVIPVLYIIVIGIINAYNFMDGINGITGTYSLVVLGGLQYVNLYQYRFIHPDLIWLPFIASIVFLYFNFRNKAKCFAGDVGSVTIGFWIIVLLISLMKTSGHIAYIFFLAVYGVDTVLTIVHRLLLKQNIFEPHRLHFYQVLANEQQWNHLLVSIIYSVIQIAIIVMVILFLAQPGYLFVAVALPLILIYVFVKPKIMVKRYG